MRYLFIAFLFVSLFGHSQGIEPSSFQGNPNKSGFLKSVTLNVDDFGDTTYLYVHVDSLSVLDSIYLQGDSLILLKNGSGQVYRSRIWDENDYSSRYDIPNPQLNDLYGDSQKLYYWDGDSWELLDRDGEIGNEGLLGLHQIATNIIGLTSSSNGFDIKHFVGLNGIQISTNELDTINIGIDTTLFEAGETQYLNPYVMGPDTVGFYLTIAQDTVLFLSTLDSTGVADSTSVVGGYGIDVVESPANTFTVEVDTSQVATPYDLTLKENVLSFTSPLSRSTNTISIPAATTSVSGHLTSTDWTTFNNKIGGSGVAGRVPYFSGVGSITSTSNLYWDTLNNELEIKGIPYGSNATEQLYICTGAANGATNANNSVFLGLRSGSAATNAYNAIFLGRDAGNGATNANASVMVGPDAGYQAINAYSTFMMGDMAGYQATRAHSSAFLGRYSGYQSSDAYFSTFIGYEAGYNAVNAHTSNFHGKSAGRDATYANNSNFYGESAGRGAWLAYHGNYFGYEAGMNAVYSQFSNFFGTFAGKNSSSTFSNYFGRESGYGVSGNYNNFFGYNTGNSFSGTGNVIIGTNITLPNGDNNMNLGGVLYGTNLYGTTTGSASESVSSGGKIGVMTLPANIARTLHVTGEVRITDLTTDTPTKIVGADADGDLAAITKGYGLSFATDTLKADTTSANGLATKYDLTQVSGGSSKAVDILGSDFTTSATSLQSTDLAYTFPSTGTYEIKVYGSYTCSNTANGINVGFIDSGGLVASYITGKHSAFTNNSNSSSTEFRKPISAIGTTLITASVNASSTPYTLISETLITVSTAGTITYGFASGSGSYSATLQAGSSLLIEKLN